MPLVPIEDTISEEDFQSAQGDSIATDVLPVRNSPVAPRSEIIVHAGLTDQIGKMAAQTPTKRGLTDGVESEGKKTKEKEKELDLSAEDVKMGIAEEDRQGFP